MDYLIVSDAHGDRAILEQLVAHYQGQVRAMFYNGDSELSADDELFKTLLPVRGNVDFDTMFPDDRTYRDQDIAIYQTHGHLFHTEVGINWLLTQVEPMQVDVVTVGHTHQLGAEILEQKLFINPGSISLPRGPYAYLKGTYAILSVTPKELKVQYYTRDFKPVEGLEFTFQRADLGK